MGTKVLWLRFEFGTEEDTAVVGVHRHQKQRCLNSQKKCHWAEE